MRILDKLVFKDLLGPFINGLFMFMTLLFAAAYLFPATDLLVKGVPFATVLRLIILSLPSVVTQTFPMAMLLGSLLGFGRISQDKELVALFAAGIGFMRTVRAVWIMGVLVSVAAFLWNEMLVPPSSRAYYEIKQNSLDQLMPSDRPLSHGIFRQDGVTLDEFISIDGGYEAKSRTLRRVSILKYSSDPKRKGQPEALIFCNAARPGDDKGLKWKYFDGWFIVYSPDPKTGELTDTITTYYDELETLPKEATIGKTFDEAIRADSNDPNRWSFNELREEIQKERASGKDTRGKEVDLYGKIALPLASLIFGIVGAALGQNKQRGGGKAMGFGLAIFIAFLYWVGYHSMFVVGKNGGLPPMLASFMADIVGVLAACILVARASR